MNTPDPAHAFLSLEQLEALHELLETHGELCLQSEKTIGSLRLMGNYPNTGKAQRELPNLRQNLTTLRRYGVEAQTLLDRLPRVRHGALRRQCTVLAATVANAEAFAQDIEAFLAGYTFLHEHVDLYEVRSTKRNLTFRQVLALLDERTKYQLGALELADAHYNCDPDESEFVFEYRLKITDYEHVIDYVVVFHSPAPLATAEGMDKFRHFVAAHPERKASFEIGQS